MENIFLKQLAVKQIEETGQRDLNSPFSFIEWKQRRPTYTEKDIVYHYNQYVVDWFTANKNKPVSQKFLLRQKYLYLLSQLQLFFSKEEQHDWYSKINLADEKELLLAIPYFAKKLKAITLYYLALRKKLKNVKLKYNLVGTEAGIEQEIQNRILEVFSSLNTELPPEIANSLPRIQDLKSNLSVKIEQLYDDSVYFDKNPALSLSAYHDPFHDITAQFFATKGLSLSSDEWIFNSLYVPVTSDFDGFVSSLTGAIFELSDTTLYSDFIEKFLGESKYLTIYSPAASVITTTDIVVNKGINSFYYPYGTSTTSLTSGQIPFVALSSLALSGATASPDLSGADIIQVKAGDEVKTAWLKYIDSVRSKETLLADLQQTSTSFIFPFPGYGLSAEDVDWTGPSLSSAPEYYFLTKVFKDAVNHAYWSQLLPTDSTEPLYLNETTLVQNGAYAANTPDQADKIFIKTRVDGELSSLTLSSAAWLYKPNVIRIPITTDTTSTSALIWPFRYISQDTAVLPEHLNFLDSDKTVAAVNVNEIYVPFAVASNNFETAEKIFKLQKPGDLRLSAIGCSWLYSPTLTSDNYVYNAQGGLSLFINPGQVTKFIWSGPDNTPLSSVFGFTEHSNYCPFVTSEETDPNKCTCKQVYYSPYGHTGPSFIDNKGNADYIAVDTSNSLEPFVLDAWRDSLSGTYENSSEFAWYKTSKTPYWGYGEWVTTSQAEPFVLKKGHTYFYKRSTSFSEKYPSYVVNFQYPDNNTLWLEAKLASDGTWVPTNNESTMKLYAGDVLKWDKPATATFHLLSATKTELFPDNINGNVWTSLDFIPLSSNAFDSTMITWPAFPRDLWSYEEPQHSLYDPRYPLYDAQYPQISGIPVTLPDVARIYWWKVTRQPTIDQFKRTKYTAWTEYDVVPFGMPVTLMWATTSTEEAVLNSQYPINLDTGVPITSADIEQIYWWKLTVDYKDNELLYPYYIYENTFTPTLPGTYYIEVSARLITGEDIHFTDIPTIYVAPLQSEYMYDSYFASFAPYLTGTYTVEVSARIRISDPTIPRISQLRELKDRILYEEDFHFTNIPPISVVPLTEDSYARLKIEQPVGGYILTQTLSGWNYSTNTFDLTSSGGSSYGGGKPYWAVLNTGVASGLEYIDEYLPNTLPEPSPITLDFGSVVEYQRGGNRFSWNQPLTYHTSSKTTQWTTISSVSSESLISAEKIPLVLSNENPPSDIILTNIINGKPVEIIYDAKSSFVWQVSVETTTSATSGTELYFNASLPTSVLSNRFYPTIAVAPVADKLYTEEDSGGFFTSSKIGASQYINKNFTAELSGEEIESTFLTEDTSVHIGGRGLSKTDQKTSYAWSEDNQWIKEPPTSNQLAGAVKKSLTKSLQTFVPYQNNSEQKQFGLVTSNSRVSPWGGQKEDKWTDTLNEPKGFTGVRNVSAWAESQVLKQNQKVMDNWVTDIFGNQYGLFKTIDEDASIYDRASVPGQLWVKTNNQLVNPAYISLSSVFEPFKTIDLTTYKQLTGEGIINVDCFFDTLMFETPNIVLYSKIQYNYDSGNVEGLLDNTRFKYLTKTDELSVNFGQTWFFETEKKVYNLYVSVSAGELVPEIYELDLGFHTLIKKFPATDTQQTLLNQALSGLVVKNVDRGLLTHNKFLKQSLITIVGTLTSNEPFVVDIVSDDRQDQTIRSVTIYTDTAHRPIPFSTQIKVVDNYFYESIPLTFQPTDTIQIYTRDYTIASVSAINDPTYFELLNFTSNVTASNDGTFVAYFDNPGLYQVNYKVGNDAGFNLGCLTLSAMSREDVILLNGEAGFLVLDGYNGRYII